MFFFKKNPSPLNEHERIIKDGSLEVNAVMAKEEVSKLYVTQSIPYLYDADASKRAMFDELWGVYRNPQTHLRDPIRIQQFMYLIGIANNAPIGDYLEAGTFQGESARLIHKLMDPKCQLYCCDTFEGFKKEDLEKEKEVAPNHTWTEGNFLDTSPESVGSYIGDGDKPDNAVMVKGWFPESFKKAGLDEKQWRFVHFDMDLYEPTRAGLEIVWPQVVGGGVMIFHDYDNNCFPGVKVAVDDFFKIQGLTAFPLGDLWGSAAIIKPFRDF